MLTSDLDFERRRDVHGDPVKTQPTARAVRDLLRIPGALSIHAPAGVALGPVGVPASPPVGDTGPELVRVWIGEEYAPHLGLRGYASATEGAPVRSAAEVSAAVLAALRLHRDRPVSVLVAAAAPREEG